MLYSAFVLLFLFITTYCCDSGQMCCPCCYDKSLSSPSVSVCVYQWCACTEMETDWAN